MLNLGVKKASLGYRRHSFRSLRRTTQGISLPSQIAGENLALWLDAGRNVLGGGARSFVAGDKAYLYRADQAELSVSGNTHFTLAAWVYPTTSGTQRCILSKDAVGGGNREYNLQVVFIGRNAFRFEVSNNGVVTTTLDSITTYAANNWYFIVAWHDPDEDTLYLQINNGTPETMAHTTGVHDGTAQFRVGAFDSVSTLLPFDGRIASVAMWKPGRPLTSAERTYLYNLGNGRLAGELGQAGTDGENLLTGLVEYWNLNEEGSAGQGALGGINGLDLTFGNTELVTNGTFATDTAWTKGTGWTIDTGDSNVAEATTAPGGSSLRQNSVCVSGRSYNLSLDILNYSAGELRALVGGILAGDLWSSNGTHTETRTADGANFLLQVVGTTTLNVDNVSLKAASIPAADGPAETIASDSSGNGNHGAVSGTDPDTAWSSDTPDGSFNPTCLDEQSASPLLAVGFSGTPRVSEYPSGFSAGKSWEFTGTTKYLRTPSGVFDPTANWSISVWFNADTFTGDTQERHVVAQTDGTGAGRTILAYNTASTKMECFVGAASSLGATNVSTNSWVHCVVTYNSSTNTITVHTNNDGGNATGSRTAEAADGAVVFGIAKTLSTGRWDGHIYDPRIYSSVLSADNVAYIYTNGASGTDPSASLVSQWLFDESNTRSYDSTTGSFQFNGSDRSINMGDVLMDSQSAVTLSTWVKFTALADWKAILGKSINDQNIRCGFSLAGSGAGANTGIIFMCSNGSNTFGYTATGLISTGQWYHVAMVFDGSQSDNAGRLKGYIDGSPVSLTFSGTIPATTSNMTALRIGSDGSTGYMAGYQCDSRVYHSALSAAQILSLAGGTSVGTPDARLKLDDGPQQPLVDGDPVIRWTGRSISLDFEQEAASKRPIYRTGANGIGGQPAIQLDGVNDLLRYAGSLTTATSGTMFLVVNADAAADHAVISSSDEGGTAAFEYVAPLNASGQLGIVDDAASANSSGFMSGGDHIITISSDGANYSMWIDGVAQTISGTDNGNWFGDQAGRDNFVVGALKHTSELKFFTGKIGEVVLTDSPVNAATRGQMERYLSNKYSITLAAPEYLLQDEFTTDDASPLTSPRICEPGPGTLTAVQNDGTLAVSGGKLVFTAQSTPGWGDLGVRAAVINRVAGRVLMADVTLTSGRLFVPAAATSATINFAAYANLAASVYFEVNGTIYAASEGAGRVVGSWSADTVYPVAIVLRSTGYFALQKIAGAWTLLWVGGSGTGNVYPAISSYDAAGSTDYFRIPDATWTPTPLASDSFNRADSTDLGSTDGEGCEEEGGSGLAWTEQNEAAEINGNRFTNEGVNTGNGAQGYVEANQADVIVLGTARITGSGTRACGVLARVSDADNWWRLDVVPNTFRLVRQQSGTPTVDASTAFTVANDTDYSLQLVATGTSLVGYANGGNRIPVTSSFNQAATKHGVSAYGSSAARTAMVDNFAVFARTPSNTPAWME